MSVIFHKLLKNIRNFRVKIDLFVFESFFKYDVNISKNSLFYEKLAL